MTESASDLSELAVPRDTVEGDRFARDHVKGARPTVTWPPLVGLAHGSRDPRAAAAIDELMAAVARSRPGLITTSAFLDLSEPDLTTAVARLASDRAVVVPLLFAALIAAAPTAQDASPTRGNTLKRGRE